MMMKKKKINKKKKEKKMMRNNMNKDELINININENKRYIYSNKKIFVNEKMRVIILSKRKIMDIMYTQLKCIYKYK